ncbi:hypothetical protein HYPBUDRAFT_134804 [Hyphopichia burtonii NRRL Y-1933]|uniref:low-specificity L-threonine aldolase n=1 Tax=Hyphopichia burtonii NRRL Y-1933 TaxID=984485 RepID=A0A1E4RMQ5_9ASCO|nr:hypothetical protein HYPBUDRAFT_134804 [Hyphopichia burtonii NRRL Y-1933]ODV68550.1 hypothetical protein HYPBUDRAFT_134804 [Hyphopichia burtonii NRRL Y-1933]
MDLSNFDKRPAHNDFRSDTFTTPTASMIKSLVISSLGDAVYNEDDSTNQLEAKVAKLAGKESGLYCVSGTLSNQIAVRVNLFQPPYSILCDYRGHIYADEAGGLSTLSQAMIQPIHPKNGKYLTLEDDIIPNVIPDDGDIHLAPTKLISLENTLHGMIFPIDEIEKISKFCRENEIRLHLDGARLWNAHVETGVSIEKYCSYFDSVSLCLSKSLGAPIGSVLVSDSKFIKKANHFKKQNGGGIRQSGILAVMASTAIDENLPLLKNSHVKAKELGKLCQDNNIPLLYPVDTNFVFVDFEKAGISDELFNKYGDKYNIKVHGNRISFHYQISDESFENVKRALLDTWEDAKKNPAERSNQPSKFYSL